MQIAGSPAKFLRQQAFPCPHQLQRPPLPQAPQQSFPWLRTLLPAGVGDGFGDGAGAGNGAGGGFGVGFEPGVGARPLTTSRSNSIKESGFAGIGMLFDPDPPVFLKLQAACPGHSFTFLQPQALKYHLCCPSGPALTPQSTFFQPAAALRAVELVAEVTGFQSPSPDLPQ